MSFKQLKAIMGIVLVCMCTACTSDEDKLEGSWTTMFSLKNDYVKYRVFTTSEYHPTYYHIVSFKKGENDKRGTFVDYITPLILDESNSDEVVVGSKISGTWEVKKDKIHLYYNDEVSLTNAENIGDGDKDNLESEMAEYFLAEYKTIGENGIPFQIINRNNKVVLELNLDNPPIVLIKKENKE